MSRVAAFPDILPTLNPCRCTLKHFCTKILRQVCDDGGALLKSYLAAPIG